MHLTISDYARRVTLAIALLALAVFLWRMLEVVVLIFAGGIVAIAITTFARLTERFTPLRAGWALAASVVGMIVVIAGFAALLGWRMTDQLEGILRDVSHAWTHLRAILQHNAAGRLLVNSVTHSVSGLAAPIASLTQAATGTAGVLVDFVVVLFIGLFLAADPELYRRGALLLVPPANRASAASLFEAITLALRQWLGGVSAAMLSVGIITGAGLWFLGVPMALSLGFFAGLCEFIPYVGPVLSAVPAILVGFSSSPTLAIEIIALYLVVHFIEAYLLVPLILKRAVALPPALGITAVLVFGILIGPLGVVLAHPLMVTSIVLVRELYVNGTSD